VSRAVQSAFGRHGPRHYLAQLKRVSLALHAEPIVERSHLTMKEPASVMLQHTAPDRPATDFDVAEKPLPIRVRPMLWVIAAICVAKVPVVHASSDWSKWCTEWHGAFGTCAALLSTSLAIVFASQLFRSGYQIASKAAYQPLREKLEAQLVGIRKSRAPLVFASLAAVGAGILFTLLWMARHTAFTSFGWFISDLPIQCACTFALSYLISCSAACVFGIRKLRVLDASLHPLHAEPENSIRAVSGTVTLALTRVILAAAPLGFHPLMSPQYDTSRQIVSVAVAGSMILIVLAAYCGYVARIRSALVTGQSDVRTVLHNRWQKIMTGPMQLDSREHVELESLALLAEHARKQPLWPFEHRGLAKVGAALMVPVASVVSRWLLPGA